MSKSCRQAKLLSAYLDKALPADRMASVRDHLRQCEFCRTELTALQQTDGLIRALPPLKPSPGFDAAFWTGVAQREQKRGRPLWVQRLSAGWRPMLAAGLTACLLAAFLLFRQADPAPSAEEIFMVENMEMLNDLELLQRLDLLENWDALQAMKEQG